MFFSFQVLGTRILGGATVLMVAVSIRSDSSQVEFVVPHALLFHHSRTKRDTKRKITGDF